MAAKKEGYTDKLIRLPDDVWEVVGNEAERVHRSLPRQLEAILRERYGLTESPAVNDLQSVLAEIQRRMDGIEEAIRPFIEVPERKAADPEPKKTKAKK